MVVIGPVPELTPAQVIQARPTGSRMFVTGKGKKEKRVCNKETLVGETGEMGPHRWYNILPDPSSLKRSMEVVQEYGITPPDLTPT